MLVLSRKVGESFLIGDTIRVTVVRIGAGGVRIGIDAPLQSTVMRGELVERTARGSSCAARNEPPKSVAAEGGPHIA